MKARSLAESRIEEAEIRVQRLAENQIHHVELNAESTMAQMANAATSKLHILEQNAESHIHDMEQNAESRLHNVEQSAATHGLQAQAAAQGAANQRVQNVETEAMRQVVEERRQMQEERGFMQAKMAEMQEQMMKMSARFAEQFTISTPPTGKGSSSSTAGVSASAPGLQPTIRTTTSHGGALAITEPLRLSLNLNHSHKGSLRKSKCIPLVSIGQNNKMVRTLDSSSQTKDFKRWLTNSQKKSRNLRHQSSRQCRCST